MLLSMYMHALHAAMGQTTFAHAAAAATLLLALPVHGKRLLRLCLCMWL